MTITDDTAAKLREIVSALDRFSFTADGYFELSDNGDMVEFSDAEAAIHAAFLAAEARSTALEAERDAEKARADAAKAEAEKMREKAISNARERNAAEATLSTLTAERDALKRERDELAAAVGYESGDETAIDGHRKLFARLHTAERERDDARAALGKIATTSPRGQGYHGPALSGYAAFEIARAVLARTGEPTDE